MTPIPIRHKIYESYDAQCQNKAKMTLNAAYFFCLVSLIPDCQEQIFIHMALKFVKKTIKCSVNWSTTIIWSLDSIGEKNKLQNSIKHSIVCSWIKIWEIGFLRRKTQNSRVLWLVYLYESSEDKKIITPSQSKFSLFCVKNLATFSFL